MKKYFIHDGDEQVGPFTIAELKEKNISPKTHIWFEGMEDWKEASEIDELKDIFKSTPPPFQKANQQKQEKKSIESTSTLERESKKKNKTASYITIAVIAITSVLLIGFLIQKNTDSKIATALKEKEVVDKQNRLIEEEEKKKQEEAERLEKEKLEKEEIELKKFKTRRNFLDFVFIDQSNYSADKVFGGITNLYYTVKNNTDYKINLIKLKVDYIRTNGGVFKTEIIDITNISPNNSKKIKAPDSYKGITVRKEILNIYSKDLSLCYEAGDFGNSSSDPYKCNN